ncbi:MAG: DUF11 domain-containing protein [Caldilineaceae bacterium]|nr:DUF11 domain-containing protein [Caldilineaceae bacterium]
MTIHQSRLRRSPYAVIGAFCLFVLLLICARPVAATDESASQATIRSTAQETIPLIIGASVVTGTVNEDAGYTVLGIESSLGTTDTVTHADTPTTLGTTQITGNQRDIEYKPNANACTTGGPPDSFTYQLNNSTAVNYAADVVIVCLNDPPVLTLPGAQTVTFETAKVLPAIEVKDADAGGSNLSFNLSVSSGTIDLATTAGLTGVTGDGTAAVTGVGPLGDLNTAFNGITYTPDSGALADELNITVDDQGATGNSVNGTTDSGSVTLNIIAPQPNVQDDTASGPEDTDILITVLANDTAGAASLSMDPDSVSITAAPANGTAVPQVGGAVKYAPAPNFNGADSFQYEACNTNGSVQGACSTAVVTLTVTPVNDSPTLVAISDFQMIEGATHTQEITVGDVDHNPGTLTVTAVSDNGNLLPNADITVLAGSGPTKRLLRVRPADGQTGVVNVTVTVKDAAGASTSRTFKITVVAPDITIRSITDGGVSVRPGETIGYTVRYANDGSGKAEGVTLEVTVPAYTTFDQAGSSAGWSCSDNAPAGTTCTMAIGLVNAGNTGNRIFAVTLNSSVPSGVSEIQINAEVQDDGTNGDDANPANNQGSDKTPIDRSILLKITKRDAPWPAGSDSLIEAGDTLLYTIRLENTGVTTAEGIVLQDTPDAHSPLVVGSVTTSKGFIASGNDAGNTNVSVNIGNIATNETVVVTFRVQIVDPVPDNIASISNQANVIGQNFASISSDDPDTADADDATVTSLGSRAVLAITKTDRLVNDGNGNGIPSPGETLGYTVEIKNQGQAPATNIVFLDTPDTSTALVAGTVSSSGAAAIVTDGNSPGDTDVRVTIPTLVAGGAVTITFNVNINNQLTGDIIEVANQGQVTSNLLPLMLTDDPDTPQANDPTLTTVAARPVLRMTKRAVVTDTNTDGQSGPGDLIDYTIIVRNVGESAQNVVMTDPLSSLLTLTPTAAGNNLVQTSRGTVVSGLNAADDTVRVTIDELGHGESATISFRVKIADTLPAGIQTVANQATVLADGVSASVSDNPDTGAPNDATTTSVTADVIMRAPMKDLAAIGGLAEPGDEIVYNPTIENVGNRTAENVRITGTLSSDTELLPDTIFPGVGGQVIQANAEGFELLLPELQPGQTWAVQLRVRIRGTACPAVQNQFTVSAENMTVEILTDDQDTTAPNDPNSTPIYCGGMLDGVLLPIIRLQ